MKQLHTPKKEPMRIAAFMSGRGSVLRKILEKHDRKLLEVVMIFSDTDDERECNAKKIAEENGIAYYCKDIRKYYSSRGYSNRKDMNVRKEYDKDTAKLLQKNRVDIVALCGYMSVVSGEICDNYLTINVHPADLRILDGNGKRLFAGCAGKVCISKARESGIREARATTHIVTTELDGGPVLIVSDAINIADSSNDGQLLEKLKEHGDWKIYPETLKRLAEGRFWIEDNFVIDLVEEKQLLRKRMKELRDKMGDEDVKSKSAAITKKLLQLHEYATAKNVMFYMGTNKEVQTEDAVSAALSAKKKVIVPITDLDKGNIIPSQIESVNALMPGAYGILEPKKRKEINAEEIELVIVPGLAFDMEGNRIGYGLGFYDKFLKKVEGKKIGLAYEMQIVDKIRTTEHDVAVDKIITEERIIECGVKK